MKINHLIKPWSPLGSFKQVHQDLQSKLQNEKSSLRLLDVSTGSCNSLIRHGWIEIATQAYGLDLSETMLGQGREQLEQKSKSAELVLGNAERLPYEDNAFDIVLNYGAVNGYTSPERAITEMLRVTRPSGKIVLFDEQCYKAANKLERFYFRRVLANHDTLKECPQHILKDLECNYECYQVYQYYYLCVITKLEIKTTKNTSEQR